MDRRRPGVRGRQGDFGMRRAADDAVRLVRYGLTGVLTTRDVARGEVRARFRGENRTLGESRFILIGSKSERCQRARKLVTRSKIRACVGFV